MENLLGKHNMKVLAIGAHPDDVELGCGGFLLSLKDEYNARIGLIICSSGALKTKAAVRLQEQKRAADILGAEIVKNLKRADGYIASDASLVLDVEEVIKSFDPSLILTHGFDDSHQDHRNTSFATVTAARYSLATILLYPPLLTREPFAANLYVDISKYFSQKLTLLSVFASQQDNSYMRPEVVTAMAVEAGLHRNCRYAEKFQIYFTVA